MSEYLSELRVNWWRRRFPFSFRFLSRRDAEDALDRVDGRRVDGRELRVVMAKYGRHEETSRDSRGSGGGGSRRRSDRR